MRQAADSFIDSIIIELCFPRGIYPEAVLYRLLHDAVTESPKDAKRFPQALWDAIGDLSASFFFSCVMTIFSCQYFPQVSVDLQELLGVPLFGPEGEEWEKEPRTTTQEYDDWIDAQFYSREVSDKFANFKDVIFPLEKTKKQPNLDKLWEIIDSVCRSCNSPRFTRLKVLQNYVSVSGKNADALWKLTENFNYAPQWTSYFVPGLVRDSDNLELASTKKKGTKKKPKELLRLANGSQVSTDSDMPPLQSLSGTDDAEDDDDDDDFPLDHDEAEDDDDSSGYNTEEEDEMRDLLREAMDVAHESDWASASHLPKEMDPFEQEDRKGNPFLKLLGSLRGNTTVSSLTYMLISTVRSHVFFKSKTEN